jgi:CheY-like chemotaxis protein
VLLDLMMPGMDGLAVLRAIRSNPALAHLPILMFTARTDGLTARIAKAEGVSAFHTKPLDMDHLVIDVRRLAETHVRETEADAEAD